MDRTENTSKESKIFSPLDSEEIDLFKIWMILRNRKIFIISTTLVISVISVFYALNLPNIYRSTALLTPVSTNSGPLSNLSGQFGSLASLAGINLNSTSGDKSQVAIEVMKTWNFIEEFIYKNSIEVEVFAAIGWSSQSNQLQIDDDLYDISQSLWVREHEPEKGEQAKPTSWELFQSFNENLIISQDEITGLISISIDHVSPYIAKEWVDLYISQINNHFQQIDRQEAVDSIKYLTQQIDLTEIREMKTIFYQLIEEQTKTLMLTEINQEYVFKIISPSRVPEEKAHPRRLLIIIIASFFGGIFSVVIVFIQHLTKSYKESIK